MKSFKLFSSFITLAVVGHANAATYHRTESLSGQSFLDAFSWMTLTDPTHGRVEYVDESTAQSSGLYSVSGNTVILRADNTTVLNPNGPGRKSFRLQSNNQYSKHVAIFDIVHMPKGCGTWPAVYVANTSRLTFIVYRENGANWPHNGEIDIVEGANDEAPNQSTLHTSPGCTMPSSRNMTGKITGNDCNSYLNHNLGCGVRLAGQNTFGHEFNRNGGGWYAVERSDTYIAIYFWARSASSVPDEVRNPGGSVDTSNWGTPAAYFPNTNCDFASHFGPMKIIINLTFCGDWAGVDYGSSKCPSTCVDFVNNNPREFSWAYFEFNALNIYQ